MDLRESKKISGGVMIGRVLMSEYVFSHLEAFFGNALNYSRGLMTMNKYKTVKEVCALTGLTRKHLYYFHHEKVVEAAAYAGYSVEGHDGYKLYDDAAVEKLRQIALYYRLGLKRGEIRDIMLKDDYDSSKVLEALLASKRTEKVHIERIIAALEYLILAGTKNGVGELIGGTPPEELGKTLLELRGQSGEQGGHIAVNRVQTDSFLKEFGVLVSDYCRLDVVELENSAGDERAVKICELSRKHLGDDGICFVIGICLSALGKGTAAEGIIDSLPRSHASALIRYIVAHPEMYKNNSHIQSRESTENRRNRK